MVEIFDDIRKLYLFRPPCEELMPYIEFFSETSAEAARQHTGCLPYTIKMFPSWTPTCWINIGAAYQLLQGNISYHIPSGSAILVTRNTITERVNLPADHLFTIKFYPGGLEAVLGISQPKLTGRLTALQDIVPGRLIAKLRALSSFEQRVQLLENFFLHRLLEKAGTTHYLHLVQQTMAAYSAGALKYNVNELSARLFTTSKTINRYFHRVIGVSPKQYFTAMRAREALTAWVAGKKGFDPGAYGYYDMSHFYRDSLKFTGRSRLLPG